MVKKILLFTMILLFMSLPVNAGSQSNITKEDVYRTIRDNFIEHNKEFTIDMSTDTLKEIGTDTDLLKAAVAIDDKNTSKDGDYLGVSVINWSEDWKYDYTGKASMTISVKYRTTAKQEMILDHKIDSVLNTLNLKNKTDYEKVKAVHDYIIKRVSYDRTIKRYTAYSALVKKSAVCEGYAAAAYRMFLDAGIDSRIIAGKAGKEAHIWNIVKVDGKWYNIDLTWDDPIMDSGKQVISYNYFLKNAKEFSDHVRDPEYNTKEFLEAYPIAKKNYNLNN